MAVCESFTVGTTADMDGNTLGCRQYHAGAAETEPAIHCRHAGPGGDGACGTNCEGFCTIAQAQCTGADAAFADAAACMTECAMFPTTPPYDVSQTGGDSFACRMYHLTIAATGPDIAKVHCPHVAAISDPCQ